MGQNEILVQYDSKREHTRDENHHHRHRQGKLDQRATLIAGTGNSQNPAGE
jgi:hypothetical protein